MAGGRVCMPACRIETGACASLIPARPLGHENRPDCEAPWVVCRCDAAGGSLRGVFAGNPRW